MAATKQDIKSWLYEGLEKSAKYIIIVCDTYDWEDYPVFIGENDDFWSRYNHYDGQNMQKIMEVYDLSMDIEQQLNEHRARHLPNDNPR